MAGCCTFWATWRISGFSGPTVEDRLGRVPFACLYFAAGIIGSAAQVALGSAAGAMSPIIGASGAIAGCMGAFLLLLPGTKIRLHYIGWFLVPFRGDWWVRAGTLLGIWIGLNLLNAFLTWSDNSMGGTAFWCHIGGFATGAALGYFAARTRETEGPNGSSMATRSPGRFPCGRCGK